MRDRERKGRVEALRHGLMAGAAGLALGVMAPAVVLAQAPGAPAQGAPGAPALAPSQRAGAEAPPVVGQLRTTQQALRQAQGQLTGPQPNIPQARTAVEAGVEVLGRLPQQAQQVPAFRTVQQQLAQAQQALSAPQPNARMLATQLEEAANSLEALIASAGNMAGAAPAAGAAGAAGAQIAVQQPAPQVSVQQPAPQVTVQQPAPQVTVQQPPPQVTVRQPPPQVTVQQPPPQVSVQQPPPQVRVEQAPPQVQVEQPRPQVTVRQPEPQVRVQQAEPQVQVQREGQPQVQVQREGQPQVTVQRQGEAQVQVERTGRAQVETERTSPQQQAATVPPPRPPVSGETRTGATVVTPPATGAGPAPAAVTAAPVGVALASVQELIGTNLVGANGRDAGEVENLLITPDGRVVAAVVEWGGFLGIGERSALVPIEEIRIGVGPGGRALLGLNREQLEALPRYDPNNIVGYGRDRGWPEGLRAYR